jgi:hypothetical protein
MSQTSITPPPTTTQNIPTAPIRHMTIIRRPYPTRAIAKKLRFDEFENDNPNQQPIRQPHQININNINNSFNNPNQI